MKKRFISKLLMAALVVTMGVFSSCKDYDDDINANTALINQLQTQVKTLDDARAKLETQISLANTAIEKAQADATAAKNEIAAAKTELEKAIADGDSAAIAEAQSRIDAAEARILNSAQKIAETEANKAAAQVKQEMIDELNAKVQALNAAINERLTVEEFQRVLETLATKQGLQEAVTPLAADIAKLQSDLKDNADADKLLKERLDALYADYVSKGALEQAVLDLEAEIGALDTKLMTLIDQKWTEANATFATLTAFNQLSLQVNANEAAIARLDQWVTNFEENVLNTLATKNELQALELQLTNLINTKTDNLQAAIDGINQTLANHGDLIQGVQDALITLRNDLESNYATKAQLTSDLNDLRLEITAAYQVYTDGKIEGLRTELSGLIETKIAANNVFLKNEIINIVNEKLAAYATTSYVDDQINQLRIDDLRTQMNNIDSQVSGIADDLNNMAAALNQLIQELEGMEIESEENAEGGNSRMRVGENAGNGIEALKQVLQTMTDRINTLYDYVNNTLNGVNGELNNITLFVTKRLTSLVYRPEGVNAYLYGFPTIKALLLQPQKTYTFEFNGRDDVVSSSAGESSKQFDIIAKYWLNPSSTDINNYKWSFDEVPAKNYITRNDHNASKCGVSVGDLKVNNKGILEVSLKIANGSNVNNALTVGGDAMEGNETYAWITTVALQAVGKEKNDSVTSDYAIIVPEYYSDLVLANNKYASATHEMGNQNFHLWSKNDRNDGYVGLLSENAQGIFSYKLAYNKTDIVDLTSIDIHYNGDAAVMSHEDAEFRGFDFKYTILTDNDYFHLDEENQTIAIAEGKNVNTSVGKVANVRVELQADGKTFAYGYLSIVITSPEVTVDIDPVDLSLICNPDKTTWTTADNTVAATLTTWDNLIAQIEEAIGMTGSFAYYQWAVANDGDAIDETNLVKWRSETAVDNKKGIIGKNGADLTWTFTEAEIYQLFYYDFKKPKPMEYATSLRLIPVDGHPELSNVTVNIKIGDEIYPTGEFSYTQRIQQYWFNQESTKIAETAEARYEIHGNVEVVGQPNANDEFFFNIAGSFFNDKFGEPGYEDPNAILIYNTNGYNYGDLATVYFDADKYYIYNAADANKTIAQMKSIAPATSFATGMSGTEYLLYISDRDATVLMAVANKLDVTTAQPVVELSNTYNNVATFQGWTYFTGMVKDGEGNITAGNALDYAYAYDLLNKNDHNEVAAGETFTTHMMLDQREYCFPIDFTANQSFKFDIRWLRPISVDEQQNHTITDAVDNGTIIKLAEHAGFLDWRDISFSASNRVNYINYYGIRAIKPNLDKAVTDINGGWTNIKYFPLLQFEDLTTEGVPPYASGNDFINKLGYVKYTNNGLNVGTFKIRMPITLLYDWGETAEQWITFTIKKTTGQDISK